jgi:pimeloyl-ACP methyl ester carboxylesterase
LKRKLLPALALFGTLVVAACGAGAQPAPQAQPAPILNFTIQDPAFTPVLGARAIYGTRNGYGYQIEVPAKWNGELVMWAHGFAGVGRSLRVQPLPGREEVIRAGYAWAASSYSANGWAVRQGSDETLDLARFFGTTVGKPTRTYIVGGSMGGNVITDSLETYPDAYDGALALCGVMTGTELFDYFLAYNLAAQHLIGKKWDLNALFDPMPFLKQLAEVNALFGTPGNYTPLGRQFDSIAKNLSGGERPFRVQGMQQTAAAGVTFFAFPLGTPIKGIVNLAPGKRVATNVNTRYDIDPGLGRDDESLNASIIRLAADPAARNAGRGAGYAVPTGKIQVPVLSMHTTGDAFVPIVLQVSYRKIVDAAGRGDLLVQRAVRRPGHCDFSQAEVMEGFNDLVSWVKEGVKPRGEDFLKPLTDAGREWTKPIRADDPGGK